jgi:hypothetical protein
MMKFEPLFTHPICIIQSVSQAGGSTMCLKNFFCFLKYCLNGFWKTCMYLYKVISYLFISIFQANMSEKLSFKKQNVTRGRGSEKCHKSDTNYLNGPLPSPALIMAAMDGSRKLMSASNSAFSNILSTRSR